MAATMLLRKATVALPESPLLKMPPPQMVAELPERVEWWSASVALPSEEPSLKMPPPRLVAELPERVEWLSASVALRTSATPLLQHWLCNERNAPGRLPMQMPSR